MGVGVADRPEVGCALLDLRAARPSALDIEFLRDGRARVLRRRDVRAEVVLGIIGAKGEGCERTKGAERTGGK